MDMFATEQWELDKLAIAMAASAEQAGPLVGCKLHLFENAVVASRTKPAGDYTAPGYTGYAAVVLTWTAPTIGGNQKPELVSNMITFRPSDALGTTTVARGLLIKTSDGAKLYAAANLESAEPLAKATDELKVVIHVDSDGNFTFTRVA